MCWGYRFYLFLCMCVLRVSVLPLSMYLYVEDIGFTPFYVFVCWGYRFYLFLCIWYLCVEDIGFTSFYVFVCWGYRYYLFLCICVLRISVLPLSVYLCVEDIGFTSSMYLFVEDIGITSFYVFVCWGYRFYLFLCICVLRISVLPLSMYVCA